MDTKKYLFVLICILSSYIITKPDASAQSQNKVSPGKNFNTYILPVSAIGLNIPYAIRLARSNNTSAMLKEHCFYYDSYYDFYYDRDKNLRLKINKKINNFGTVLNYSLVAVSVGCLWPELSTKNNILVNATLLGLQSTVWAFSKKDEITGTYPVSGISIVWSCLTGVILGKLYLMQDCPRSKSRLLVPLVLNSLGLIYYALKAPPMTTVAHGVGIAVGALISIPLFKYN